MKHPSSALALVLIGILSAARGADPTGVVAPIPGYPVGWCIRAKPEVLEQAKAAGFEYVELALQDLMPLSDKEFATFAGRLDSLGLSALSGYNPLPPAMKLVGPDANPAAQDELARRVVARAGALRLRYLILNSGGCWKVPEGYDRERAFAQLADFCGRFSEQAEKAGVTVLIEPQRSRDTNMITTVDEALELVAAVNRPGFQMMVDYSFLAIQHDDPRSLLKACGHLRDVHISNPEENRTYPMAAGESDYAWFFAALKEIGYRGGLSVHGSTADFAADAPRAIAFLRSMAAGLAGNADTTALLDDDFRALPLGLISPGVIGAQAEYHYIASCAPKGNWSTTAFRSADGAQRAWRLIEEEGHRYLAQTYQVPPQERVYSHPLAVAGDDLWGDYVLTTRVSPGDGKGRSGVAFRYRTNRKYYFAGIEEGKAVLTKLNDGNGFRTMDETILDERPFDSKPGEFISIAVAALGDRVGATFDGRVSLAARDGSFAQGKIALLSDLPARFDAVRVVAPSGDARRYDLDRGVRGAEEERLQSENPRMALWKKIKTPNFGVGRNLRFGDLEGKGGIDILVGQVDSHGPADAYSEVGCLTALDLDGNVLWQNGLPDPWKFTLTSDVAMQIHDLYGDGRTEVVYCRDFELVVADAKTGRTLRKVPTPETPFDPLTRTKRFPRVLGDAIAFCDLSGAGHRGDILLKDRYQNIWAYNNRLELLWHRHLNTGHYPFPVDLYGNGREEVMIGYTLLDPEGRTIWSHETEMHDHADGVAWVQFREGAEPRLICNASDEGVFFADEKGNILRHYQIGHTQNVSVAHYRSDLPGLQAVSIDFWANQGIVHFFDSDGKMYKEFEPCHQGSMLSPVNWTGQPAEYWMLSSNPVEGGLFDGWGRRVVRFPADGHPDLCCAALDLTGDCRDEIVCWDPYEIWIYTQSDNPKAGRLYKPKRNPLYNWSNYQTTVSLPGWSNDSRRDR